MHFDRRHPYERFMSRLSATQASSKQQAASGFSVVGSRNRSRLTAHVPLRSQLAKWGRLRIWLYGSVAVFVAATLLWSGQQTHGISVASADGIDTTTTTLAAARAKALELSPLNPVELLKKATPLIDGPRRTTAIEFLTEANRRDPTIRDVNLQLGYAYIQNGEWQAAKTALDRARTVDGSWPETHRLLAVVYHQLGDTKGEQEALARAKQFELVAKLPELTD